MLYKSDQPYTADQIRKMAAFKGVEHVELKPGELFFGGGPVEVRTLLGSCVAITVWHPRYRVGGMCHYLLAHRDQYRQNKAHGQGYYASDVLNYFLERIKRIGAKPADFEVKLFGGGNMFDGRCSGPSGINVAKNNVEEGKKLLFEAGFRLSKIDAGGVRYRKINFLLETGDVWVQYGKHTRHLLPSL